MAGSQPVHSQRVGLTLVLIKIYRFTIRSSSYPLENRIDFFKIKMNVQLDLSLITGPR